MFLHTRLSSLSVKWRYHSPISGEVENAFHCHLIDEHGNGQKPPRYFDRVTTIWTGCRKVSVRQVIGCHRGAAHRIWKDFWGSKPTVSRKGRAPPWASFFRPLRGLGFRLLVAGGGEAAVFEHRFD